MVNKQASEIHIPCNKENKYIKSVYCHRCGKAEHLPDQCYFKDL